MCMFLVRSKWLVAVHSKLFFIYFAYYFILYLLVLLTLIKLVQLSCSRAASARSSPCLHWPVYSGQVGEPTIKLDLTIMIRAALTRGHSHSSFVDVITTIFDGMRNKEQIVSSTLFVRWLHIYNSNRCRFWNLSTASVSS